MIRIILSLILTASIAYNQPYPDQHYFYEKENLIKEIDSQYGVEVSSDGKSIILSEGTIVGTIIFKPDSSEFPFDRGLPSWNGHSPNDYSSFKVKMRFYPVSGGINGWSPWLTVGFWKENIWPDYGIINFNNDEIDIQVDYVVMKSYFKHWQFKVDMKRTSSSQPSPSLHKLSFFVSDQQTTNNVNITSLINDKPEAIFVDAEHFYQNDLDPEIGGSICSPTSVSMVLRSYNIEVDPLQFAKDTRDPYSGLYGVWPRVVQHAAEYGLNGSVNRYRSWTDAREVLASGGRVVMSVGSPLYSNGHLMMLAGFDAYGNPLAHDPAKSNGYGYKHDKRDLSESWFNKGGIAYTFFPEDTTSTAVITFSHEKPRRFRVLTNYPNPFNPQTSIKFEIPEQSYISIIVYDVTGTEVEKLFGDILDAGAHILNWDASNLPSGNYFIRIASGDFAKTIKAVLIK